MRLLSAKRGRRGRARKAESIAECIIETNIHLRGRVRVLARAPVCVRRPMRFLVGQAENEILLIWRNGPSDAPAKRLLLK